MTPEELGARFTWHPPKEDQSVRYEQIRHWAADYAVLLGKWCPVSRELTLALTHLEETVMWANAAIARRE